MPKLYTFPIIPEKLNLSQGDMEAGEQGPGTRIKQMENTPKKA